MPIKSLPQLTTLTIYLSPVAQVKILVKRKNLSHWRSLLVSLLLCKSRVEYRLVLQVCSEEMAKALGMRKPFINNMKCQGDDSIILTNQVSAPETQVKLPPPIDSVHHYHKEGYPAGSLSAGGVYCRQSELLSKYQDLLEPTILPLPSASQFYVEYICALPSEFF